MVRDHPVEVARAMAGELKAGLAIGGEATERAIEQLGATVPGQSHLDRLGEAAERAEAISARTRAAAAERLASSLNTRLAIHPDTIRRASQGLLAAEAELRRSERQARRAAMTGPVGSAVVGALIVGAAVLAVTDHRVAGLVVAGVALGAAVGLAAVIRRFCHQPADSSEALRRAVAVAGWRWAQVGGGAEPTEVDVVVRRYEPQHQAVAELVGENPAVRAADRVAEARRAAWIDASRAEEGKAVDVRAAMVDAGDPAELLRLDGAELWLTTPTDLPAAAPTLVVASPYAGLSDARARRLHRRLMDLPADTRVIVVLSPEGDPRSEPSVPQAGRSAS